MTRRQKDPLRPLSAEERAALEQLSRATSEPASHAARATLVLAVADGGSYTAAARRRGGGAVRRCGAGAHPRRGAADARPGGGRDDHLVAEYPAPGAAPRPRRAAGGERGHRPARAARGRAALAAGPQLGRDRRGGAPAQGRAGDGDRPGRRPPKRLLEAAYRLGAEAGLAVWCQDEAGPFQTAPYPGGSWQPAGLPAQRPHEYVRNGTAKLLTLFRPASGEVRAKGVTTCPNQVLHAWLRAELATVLAALPPAPPGDPAATRAAWAAWQAGLGRRFTLPEDLPPLRLLLVLDNLAGHKTPELVLWLCAHGVMPRYTPLGGSWLNMAESIQRILKRRALEGTHLATPREISAALEATARGWNAAPTPFAWGGKRAARRDRARQRRHALGGSGAQTRRPIRRRSPRAAQWRYACQPTH